jgi:hypothetical protein
LGLILLLAGIATIGLPVEGVSEPALMSWVRELQRFFNWLSGGSVLLVGGIIWGALTLDRPKPSSVLWFRLLIRSTENLLGAAILFVVGFRMSVFAHASWKGHVYTDSELFILPGVLLISCAFYLGAAAIDWAKIKSLPVLCSKS